MSEPVPYEPSGDIEAMINAATARLSPLRGIASVVVVGTAGYRSPAADRIGVGPGEEVSPPTGEVFAHPAASQAMLDDAAFDVDQWLASEIARDFAAAEASAFVKGDGVNRPRGFLGAALESLPSGADGGFGERPADRLIDVVQALRPPFRAGAAWAMNSATLASVRKLRSDDGAVLWAPSLAAGQSATLLGYPLLEVEDMPDIAPGSLSIAFGDFREGYLITERETQILRDPHTNKPCVHFYATKRVGGTVRNADAIKLMRFSAR